jgi:hypothetical protein
MQRLSLRKGHDNQQDGQQVAIATACRQLVQLLRSLPRADSLGDREAAQEMIVRLIAIFFCVDVKLIHALIEWLADTGGADSVCASTSSALSSSVDSNIDNNNASTTSKKGIIDRRSRNLDVARRYIHRLMKNQLCVPIIFHVCVPSQPANIRANDNRTNNTKQIAGAELCLAHLHAMPTFLDSDDHTHKQRLNPDSIVISKVPCVTADTYLQQQQRLQQQQQSNAHVIHSKPSSAQRRNATNTQETDEGMMSVSAVVCVGDYVCLRGLREDWHIVHELNTDRDVVMLRRARVSELPPSHIMMTADTHHHRAHRQTRTQTHTGNLRYNDGVRVQSLFVCVVVAVEECWHRVQMRQTQFGACNLLGVVCSIVICADVGGLTGHTHVEDDGHT